jgi:hypothetical protein
MFTSKYISVMRYVSFIVRRFYKLGVIFVAGRGKGVARQAKVAQGGSGTLRLRMFSTFSTMKAVRSSPLRTGRLYPHEYPGTHF